MGGTFMLTNTQDMGFNCYVKNSARQLNTRVTSFFYAWFFGATTLGLST
jgi:hypothetical protein